MSFLAAVVKDDEYMQKTWELTTPWRERSRKILEEEFGWKVAFCVCPVCTVSPAFGGPGQVLVVGWRVCLRLVRPDKRHEVQVLSHLVPSPPPCHCIEMHLVRAEICHMDASAARVPDAHR